MDVFCDRDASSADVEEKIPLTQSLKNRVSYPSYICRADQTKK